MKEKVKTLIYHITLSAVVFFISAVIIFSMRSKKTQSFYMPNFINKNFINVYDEFQRLELRVKLSTREYQDLPEGLILSQSVAPGKIAFAHDNLKLIVNQPKPFLNMPDLKNTSVENAKAIIERIPANGKVYPLKLVSVANVVTNKFPNNSVIAQFPYAGDKINSNEKVYILVAVRSESENFLEKDSINENKSTDSSLENNNENNTENNETSKENNTSPIIEKTNKINDKKLKKIKEQTFFLNFKIG